MESSCFELIDEGKTYCVFTGDTVFLGEIGRPDLAVKSDLTKEQLAEKLFDSIANKIKKLPKEVILYPGHGAGSACGKSIQKGTHDTLGN
jgi:glyoxylase-like metal-dependent hydrolase (beta-lactamase superfamily II)